MDHRESHHLLTESLPRFTGRMGLLLLLTGIFLSNFVARILPAPLLVIVEQELQIGHANAASLFLFISSGVCIGLLGSGYVASRLTHRKTVILSALLLGSALLTTSMSSSIGAMRLCLFLVGMSAGFYFPSGIAIITTLIRPGDWGKALAVHELAPNLGFVAAPVLVETLSGLLSWRHILGAWGVFTLLIGAMFFRFAEGGAFPGATPHYSIFRRIAAKGSFWIITIAFGLSVGGSLGVYAVTPLYLVTERGMNLDSANTLVALSRVPGIPMALVAGWLVDLIGVKRSIRSFLLTTGAATLFVGSSPNSWIQVAIFLQAISSVCFFPAGFAALARIFPASERSLAIAISVPVAILLGAGIIPTLLGYLAERGFFSLGFSLVGGSLILGAACFMLLRTSLDKNL